MVGAGHGPGGVFGEGGEHVILARADKRRHGDLRQNWGQSKAERRLPCRRITGVVLQDAGQLARQVARLDLRLDVPHALERLVVPGPEQLFVAQREPQAQPMGAIPLRHDGLGVAVLQDLPQRLGQGERPFQNQLDDAPGMTLGELSRHRRAAIVTVEKNGRQPERIERGFQGIGPQLHRRRRRHGVRITLAGHVDGEHGARRGKGLQQVVAQVAAAGHVRHQNQRRPGAVASLTHHHLAEAHVDIAADDAPGDGPRGGRRRRRVGRDMAFHQLGIAGGRRGDVARHALDPAAGRQQSEAFHQPVALADGETGRGLHLRQRLEPAVLPPASARCRRGSRDDGRRWAGR